MGRIIVSETITLDGVIEDPAGAEGFERGGWIGRIGDQGRAEAAQVLLDEALDTEAMLMGRHTYDFLAGRWPARSGALADRLNTKPKYVVSSTLSDPTWNNTNVLRGDVIQTVSALKQQLAGDLNMPASFQLLQALWKNGLVDELRLMVYPTVLGAGRRLFERTEALSSMRLTANRTIAGDLVLLVYKPA